MVLSNSFCELIKLQTLLHHIFLIHSTMTLCYASRELKSYCSAERHSISVSGCMKAIPSCDQCLVFLHRFLSGNLVVLMHIIPTWFNRYDLADE